MKKLYLLLIVAAIIILPIAYYLLSPLWNVVEADEASPLENLQIEPNPQVQDNLESMDELTMQDFMEQTKEMEAQVMVMEDDMPTGPQLLAQATFMERAHHVEGEALLIETDGKKIIRFEDFDTVNGPNLHIYLSSDLGEDDFIDLGPIKATKGNVNYELPEGIDLDRYNKVLVWCVPFGVLFSYADLS